MVMNVYINHYLGVTATKIHVATDHWRRQHIFCANHISIAREILG